MPLRPDLRNLRDANGDLVYRGPAWKARRERLLERAGNNWDRCKKPNHEWVWVWGNKAGDQYWTLLAGIQQRWHYCSQGGWIGNFALYGAQWREARRIRVVLTMAHLAHDPLRNDDEDLAMLCQWCHLNWDKVHHKETRSARKDAARPLLAGVAE
jgi:hypothetical protein